MHFSPHITFPCAILSGKTYMNGFIVHFSNPQIKLNQIKTIYKEENPPPLWDDWTISEPDTNFLYERQTRRERELLRWPTVRFYISDLVWLAKPQHVRL